MSHLALESITKGAVTSVATLKSQLLGGKRTLSNNSIVIKTNEMVDAQIVNISIIIRIQTREILTEIESVSSNGFGKLG